MLDPLASARPRWTGPAVVTDVHSRLARSRVRHVVRPTTVDGVRATVERARERGLPLSVAGGRHAMGGQAFVAGGVLLDATGLDRIVALDADGGVVEVEGGVRWPALVDGLEALQRGRRRRLGIVQKQTGADSMTLAGSVSANVHGRALDLPPLGAQVADLRIVDAEGRVRRVDRASDPRLFSLVVGGYGAFGVVVGVTLRLAPVTVLRRRVDVIDCDGLEDAFRSRLRDGFRYGDFQFAIDAAGDDFLRRGVFSCYEPVEELDGRRPTPSAGRELSLDEWRRLVTLAHTDKAAAFRRYAEHYLATDGQLYASDRSQLAPYLEGYHEHVDRALGCDRPGGPARGTEAITELYVPRGELAAFLGDARELLRRRGADVVYGTVRRIERDEDSLLAWAREPWACVVLNLHVAHTPAGLVGAKATFRALFDAALARGGSFYLTYHRWARRDQLLSAHPTLVPFLDAQRAADPGGVFASDWLRHVRRTVTGH